MKKSIIVNFIFYLLMGTSSLCAKDITIIPDAKLKSKNIAKPLLKSDVATTQFTKVEITNSPVVNLSQFLKQKQSVIRLTHSSGDVNQTALSLRGFGDNAAANSLILVDGFPWVNPSLLAPNFNAIPLSDIERIEILQGSKGTLWGNQAVGGVINIITKHPKKLNLATMMSIESYHGYHDNIYVAYHIRNGLFFKLFGLMSGTNNYRDHNFQKFNNIAMQIGKDYTRGFIFFNIQSYRNKAYFPGGLSLAQFQQHPRQATEFHNKAQYRTHVFQILSKHEINNNWLLETRINYHSTEGEGLIYLNFNRVDSLIGFSPRLIGTLNRNKITLGYEGVQSHYQLITQKIHENSILKQNDLYAQDVFAVTKKIDLTLGIRAAWQTNCIPAQDHVSKHSRNNILVTEQGINYHLNDNISLFIRRDGNFSFPKANEETWLSDNVKSLQVQTGTSYESGINWQMEKLISQLSLYRLDLKNEIAFDPSQTSNQPFGAFNNLDKTIRYGISLAEQYQIAKINMNGQFNYVSARFASGPFANNFIPAVPAFNGNIGLIYHWKDQWAIQWSLLYTGSRFASENLQNSGKKIPSYWINDVAIQYFIRSFIFSLEIRNLFNKNYPNYVFYDSYSHQNTYYPAAGINYLFTLKMNIN